MIFHTDRHPVDTGRDAHGTSAELAHAVERGIESVVDGLDDFD